MCASRACDECGAAANVVFQIGSTVSRSGDTGCVACRACVLDPARQIGVIDRRGDHLHDAQIARELDAQTAITLHLYAKDGCGQPLELPQLPASYQHVLATLDRCRRVDAGFSTVISELRERYEQAAYFGPKQMLLVQWRLSQSGIVHERSNFVVSTRNEKEIAQIRGFDDWRKKKIAPYLSWAQRARFGF